MANSQAESRIILPRCCLACHMPHRFDDLCPAELVPVEHERHGWRVNADTPHGIDAYGVLLARCTEGWRARILTYPNVLWLVPGCGETIKFAGTSVADAERQAADYIRAHCRRKGYELRPQLSPVPHSWVEFGCDPRTLARMSPAERKIRFLAVRFGVGGATEPGGTGNLSETGLFVITNTPVERGKHVSLALNVDVESVIPLSGDVVWSRKGHLVGRSPGMGVKLETPPPGYLEYVSRLA